MARIGILGSKGRMGVAIGALAAAVDVDVAGGADVGDDIGALARLSDVLIDFSTTTALAEHLVAARLTQTPILIGTTGLDAAHHVMIDDAARDVAILQAANTSLGINLLQALIEQATARLGADWDIEVLEMHHRYKVDAPSGTALLLAQAAAKGRGKSLPELSRFERMGVNEPREQGTIGFASLRGGSVAGDHMVILATEGERIELGHRADNRAIFARGAIRGALWLIGKPPARYGMVDVLGL